MASENDVMEIYLYRRDVETLLAKSPPKTSPLWNELNDSQRNLIDALEHAQEMTYE